MLLLFFKSVIIRLSESLAWKMHCGTLHVYPKTMLYPFSIIIKSECLCQKELQYHAQSHIYIDCLQI